MTLADTDEKRCDVFLACRVARVMWATVCCVGEKGLANTDTRTCLLRGRFGSRLVLGNVAMSGITPLRIALSLCRCATRWLSDPLKSRGLIAHDLLDTQGKSPILRDPVFRTSSPRIVATCWLGVRRKLPSAPRTALRLGGTCMEWRI